MHFTGSPSRLPRPRSREKMGLIRGTEEREGELPWRSVPQVEEGLLSRGRRRASGRRLPAKWRRRCVVVMVGGVTSDDRETPGASCLTSGGEESTIVEATYNILFLEVEVTKATYNISY